MSIAVIDYGMGNLFSVAKALEAVGVSFEILTEPASLLRYERAILPGVGAFSDGMTNLHYQGWVNPLKQFATEKPLLGICLGMQLFMTKGFEHCEVEGLGIISGEVVKLFGDKIIRLPHVGWNELIQRCEDPIFSQIRQNEDFYFVHSYCC